MSLLVGCLDASARCCELSVGPQGKPKNEEAGPRSDDADGLDSYTTGTLKSQSERVGACGKSKEKR